MRVIFSGVFFLLVIALGACIHIAFHSHKSIGRAVATLLCALLPPVIGNTVIIITSNRILAMCGYTLYFVGMNMVMYALLHFTFQYCHTSWPSKALRTVVRGLLLADTLQYVFNAFFHQAFNVKEIIVDQFIYWKLVPLLSQTGHRILDYSIFFAVIIVFFVKVIRVPRIYSERYSVILLAMGVGGAWQSYYIFSGTPVDKSMIGFAVFGILVFYFSLYYRPMRLLDRMLANIASEQADALFFFDAVNGCIWANESGIHLAGLEENEFENAHEKLEAIFGTIQVSGEEWSGSRVIGEGETASYYALEKHSISDERGKKAGSFLRIRDNTEEQRAVQIELYNAKHDTLTGLYVREYLYEQVRNLVDGHPDIKYSVVFVDVKDFKIVNDIFGNAYGDYALQCIADAIRRNAPKTAVYGRLAGDTFGLCMPTADFDAARYEKDFSNFVVNMGLVQHQILMHLGVYEVTESGIDASVMFDRAHMAISTIKDEYQTHIAYYDDEMRKKVLWDQHISGQLEEALATRQIRPYLQPIMDQTGKVAGAEALVRWIHPTHGFLPPIRFVPVFEKNGMIAQLDRYMWHCAGEILARWKKEGRDAFISINISPKDFYFIDVAAEIKSVVREFDIDPAKLRIEITETVVMTDIERRMKMLSDLKDEGFIIEMDDFGSGYSSLNMLKDMPVDVLKIDMAFLTRTKQERKAQTIIGSIMQLSDSLHISSLTEGVETVDNYRMLRKMGCRYFQGYYFSKPVPVEEFERLCFAEEHPEWDLTDEEDQASA